MGVNIGRLSARPVIGAVRRWVIREADRGATALEYALLIGLVALVLFGALMLLGSRASGLYESVSSGF